MTLHDIRRRVLAPWQRWRNARLMSRAVPGYRASLIREQEALQRGCTQGVHKAREQRTAAVHKALAGGRYSMPAGIPDWQADRIREGGP